MVITKKASFQRECAIVVKAGAFGEALFLFRIPPDRHLWGSVAILSHLDPGIYPSCLL